MDQLLCVHDSTSNLVFLNDHVSSYRDELKTLSGDEYIQSIKSISAPALIFELSNSGKRHYYRPFGRYKALLTGAYASNDTWKVMEYFENPSIAFLISLFKKYLLYGGLTLYRQHEIADEFFRSVEVLWLGNSTELCQQIAGKCSKVSTINDRPKH